MKTSKLLLVFWVVLALFSCKTVKNSSNTATKDDNIIEVVFLQLNDVYEISPSPGENTGGLARVATLRQQLLKKNPNTYTVLAGDFISPSVAGTVKFEGKRIRGRQMIETLNALGLDYAAFGNHEFDYDEPDLQARLDESNFIWIGTNVRQVNKDGTKQPFAKTRNGKTEQCPDFLTVTAKDADGTIIRIGMISATLPSNKKSYVHYEDEFETFKRIYLDLRTKTDFCVALTHLAVEDDKKLSAMFPAVPLVMGGHEHENQRHVVGDAVVAKADANAKTVYVHTMRYNKKTKECQVSSVLKKIDASIADEPITASTVAKWEKIKLDALSAAGFEAEKKVITLKEPLDCREVMVRNKQMPIGRLITSAMLMVAKNKPDCAIVNSGSIRIDDIVSGDLTELDVVRILPFGGGLAEVEMRGSLLRKTMDASLKNAGNGGYLQYQHLHNKDSKWYVNEVELKDDAIYKVILGDFLLTGMEQNMAFLKAEPNADGKGTTNPDVLSISKPDGKDKSDLRNDIRLALIHYLRGQK